MWHRLFGPSFFLKSVKSNTEFVFISKIRPEWETGFATSQIWQKTSDSFWRYVIAAEGLRKSTSFWLFFFFFNVGIKI